MLQQELTIKQKDQYTLTLPFFYFTRLTLLGISGADQLKKLGEIKYNLDDFVKKKLYYKKV